MKRTNIPKTWVKTGYKIPPELRDNLNLIAASEKTTVPELIVPVLRTFVEGQILKMGQELTKEA